MTIPISPPIFSAICTRCDDIFQTQTWKAPFNTLCPECLVTNRIKPVTLWVDVINTAWGVGS